MDPLLVLAISLTLTIAVSACCSLVEAALYAVPLTHVRQLVESGSRSGKVLQGLKDDIGRPITAILVVNTIANTGGATIAGRAGAEIFDEIGLVVFSVCFVLAILYCSEVLPKIVGVVLCKRIAQWAAIPLHYLVWILKPVVLLSEGVAKRLAREKSEPTISEQDVLSLAAMGTEEGALEHFEGSVITNVLGLDRLSVGEVLTPRVVVFRLPEETTIGEVRAQIVNWDFSRVPLYSQEDPDHLVSYVTQRDIYHKLLGENDDKTTLKDLSRPLQVVPAMLRVDKLLLEMFEKREHICSVVNEHGGLAGIITLEDIIEEIVGREIVDEYDTISDMRTFARVLRVVKKAKKGSDA